jgi:hypothetical protein
MKQDIVGEQVRLQSEPKSQFLIKMTNIDKGLTIHWSADGDEFIAGRVRENAENDNFVDSDIIRIPLRHIKGEPKESEHVKWRYIDVTLCMQEE